MKKLTETLDKSVKAIDDRKGKYLTFTLADDEYGIEITKIREIIGTLPITSVPRTPDFVRCNYSMPLSGNRLIWITTGSTSTGILPGSIITIHKIFFG